MFLGYLEVLDVNHVLIAHQVVDGCQSVVDNKLS